MHIQTYLYEYTLCVQAQAIESDDICFVAVSIDFAKKNVKRRPRKRILVALYSRWISLASSYCYPKEEAMLVQLIFHSPKQSSYNSTTNNCVEKNLISNIVVNLSQY